MDGSPQEFLEAQMCLLVEKFSLSNVARALESACSITFDEESGMPKTQKQNLMRMLGDLVIFTGR